MKMPHLIRVGCDPSDLAPLIAAAEEGGLRSGWLELGENPEPPPRLAEATTAGVMRAVAAGDERSVTVKARKGHLVVKDLLREHFLGCAVVFVRGEIEAPLLSPEGDRWTLREANGQTHDLDLPALLKRFRRPSR